jgi:hypothetical protein
MASMDATSGPRVTKKLDALPERNGKYDHLLDGSAYLLEFDSEDERRRTLASLRAVAHRRGLLLKQRQFNDAGIEAAVLATPKAA